MEACYVAGADPELMLISPQGRLVSAIPRVPGTKEKPHQLRCGAVQHDNVMAEFNVTPSGTSEELEHNMREVLRELSDIVAPCVPVVRASANFPARELDNDIAKVFGCDPDFDSWTLMMNSMDGTAPMSTFRSAGGHYHIGKKKTTAELLEDPYGKIEVVKMLDIFQGIPSIVLDNDPTAGRRRKLYGRAGAHRPKDYGVEYRALGNFWVRGPELVHLMYELAERAVALTLNGESQKIIEQVGPDRIQEVINTSDKRTARRIVKDILSHFLDRATTEKILTVSPIKSLHKLTLKDAWSF